MAKHAYFVVTPELLVEMCIGEGPRSFSLVKNGFPADTRIVRMGHDSFGRLNLVVTSEVFDDIDEGGSLPRLADPVFNKVYGNG